MVPVAEIADPKNDYNLNLPRYIDSTEPEDLQDIDGHLRGGIPERDIDATSCRLTYWKVMPGRARRLVQEGRPPRLLPVAAPHRRGEARHLRSRRVHRLHTQRPRSSSPNGRQATIPQLKGFAKDGHPKALIETIAEDLLATFKTAPLLDAYDIYQHLMDYWAETMQDDCYLIAADGWKAGAQPREIRQVKNKENKLSGPSRTTTRRASAVQVRPDPGRHSHRPLFRRRAGCHRALEAELAAHRAADSTKSARSKAARKGCSRKSSKARARSRRSPPRP